MRRRCIVLVVIASLIGVLSPSLTTAQTKPAPNDVLTKATSELTDADIRTYFELALTDSITVDQAKNFMDGLSKDQRVQLNKIIDEMAKPHKPTPEEIEEAQSNEDLLRKQSNAPSAILACDPAAQQKGFCWLQPIEYYSGGWIQILSHSWHQRYTTICDNDASDTDLVVYFNVSSSNPDGLRWSTTSAGLFTVLSAGSQSGFDFDNWGSHLCIENRAGQFYTDSQIAASLMMYRVQ